MSTQPTSAGSRTAEEIASQPAMWARALGDPDLPVGLLPGPGGPVLVIGCGTSYYVGDAYAALRTAAGLGRTRAVIASELTWVEETETVVLLSRSGTTSDVERVARRLRPDHRVVGIIGTPDSPIAELCHDVVPLAFADEESVVQTRYATTSLAVLRRSIGDTTKHLVADADAALSRSTPLDADTVHLVFLGTGWTLGLAHEAALKCREASGAWTEAYALMEYQHGPIAAAGPRSLIWSMDPVPSSLRQAVEATGALVVEASLDPMAEVIVAQRAALELAARAGRNPDHPPFLARSVIVG